MKESFLIIPMLFSSFLMAETLDYKVIEGQFSTSEGVIPSGCIGQLMTEMNGDNSVASIFINRNSLRGCIAANFPYPGGNEEGISYDIASSGSNNTYNLNVCDNSGGGSMGAICDKIIVQFINRTYITSGQPIKVLSLDKVGEW